MANRNREGHSLTDEIEFLYIADLCARTFRYGPSYRLLVEPSSPRHAEEQR